MSLISAKCINCSANIQVDASKEAGICQFCGSAFITEKAISAFNILNTVNVGSGGNTIQIIHNYAATEQSQQLVFEQNKQIILDKDYKVTIRRKKAFKGSFIKFVVHTENYTYPLCNGDVAEFTTIFKNNKVLIQQLNKSLDVGETSKLNYELEFNVINHDVEFNFEMGIFPSPYLSLKSHTAPKAVFNLKKN